MSFNFDEFKSGGLHEKRAVLICSKIIIIVIGKTSVFGP
jgi:hypothetical protein